MCFLDTNLKIYPIENFEISSNRLVELPRFWGFYKKSWENNEIHAKSLNFTWNSWILLIFTKSAESRKLHRPIWRFFEIFFRIDFVFGVQKTYFRGRCDRYRGDGVALRFWKSRKYWNFKGTFVIQSQWFGIPRVLLHRWATVMLRILEEKTWNTHAKSSKSVPIAL